MHKMHRDMNQHCVACGEISEGKPLYKKLGGHPDVEVFAALVKMQLVEIDPAQRYNCYLCWDCDEIIGEEYTNFCATEKKIKEDARKRREQDVIRNQKLNKKLTKALQKVREEEICTAQGIVPPISSYKQKAQNRYHSSHCLLCSCTFESRNGFQRYHLQKMIDDHTDVFRALRVLSWGPEVQEKDKSKRFICSACYNKVRRHFKTAVSGREPLPTEENGVSANNALKCKTFVEHAEEIAELLPPHLEGIYKIMGKESQPQTVPSSSGSPHLKKHIPQTHPRPGIRTHVPKHSTSGTKEATQCNVCGLCYTGRPSSFWMSLTDRITPENGMTIHKALKELDTELATVSESARKQALVCKICSSKIRTGVKHKLNDPVEPTKNKEDKQMGLKKIIRRPGSTNKNINKDKNLLKMINQSRHLRFRGKVVELRGFVIQVLDVNEILIGRTEKIPCEYLENLYMYTNFGRRKRIPHCCLCEKVVYHLYSHWLDDPIEPPNLMVPIKWAYLSTNATKNNLSGVNGPVCYDCHSNILKSFTKFALEKILVNETSLTTQEALKTYKISFDSNNLNVVAEVLQLPTPDPPSTDETPFNLTDDLALSDTDDEEASPDPSKAVSQTDPTKQPVQPDTVKPSSDPVEPMLPSSPVKQVAQSDPVESDPVNETVPSDPIEPMIESDPVKETVQSDPVLKEKPCPLSVRLKRDELKDSPEKKENLSMEDDTAPFTQRKKPRFNGQTTKKTPYKNPLQSLWQTVQQININDLVSKDIQQPLRRDQLTYGLFKTLDDYRTHMGASLQELIQWLQKLLPQGYSKRFCESSLKEYLESPRNVSSYIDSIPESLFLQEDPPIIECYLEEEDKVYNVDQLITNKQRPVPRSKYDSEGVSDIKELSDILKTDLSEKWVYDLYPFYNRTTNWVTGTTRYQPFRPYKRRKVTSKPVRKNGAKVNSNFTSAQNLLDPVTTVESDT